MEGSNTNLSASTHNLMSQQLSGTVEHASLLTVIDSTASSIAAMEIGHVIAVGIVVCIVVCAKAAPALAQALLPADDDAKMRWWKLVLNFFRRKSAP